MLRKTKIIATLGPATSSAEAIRDLIAAGADVFRLNMSHASHEWVREVTAGVRTQGQAQGRDVALLMDLEGPAIRTGIVEHPLVLKPGDRLELTVGDALAREACSVTVNYLDLPNDVSVGDTMLVDNGVLHLKVLAIDPERIVSEVLTAGKLGSLRHVNLPGVHVKMPAMSAKDNDDVGLAAELGIDFVALSFVRESAHVEQLQQLLSMKDCPARIVAKIEDQEAMNHLDDIILASDAVMVARGDLGIEVNIEELPIIQRIIVKRCLALGRRVIVATHMLESMIENPNPTRAEVTDVANAVFEQADAVMLSGETSVGRYPVDCIRILDRIAKRIERSGGAGYAEAAESQSTKHKTARAAVVLANSIESSCILVFTGRGIMANYVAHLRPEEAPVFAFSPDAGVCRRLALSRAVRAFRMDFAEEPQRTIADAVQLLKTQGLLCEGNSIVILSDVFADDYEVDSIHLQKA